MKISRRHSPQTAASAPSGSDSAASNAIVGNELSPKLCPPETRRCRVSAEKILLLAVLCLAVVDLGIQFRLGKKTPLTKAALVVSSPSGGTPPLPRQPSAPERRERQQLWGAPTSEERTTRQLRERSTLSGPAARADNERADVEAAMSPFEASIATAEHAKGRHQPPLEKCSKPFVIKHVGGMGGLERNACRAQAAARKQEGGGKYGCETLLPPEERLKQDGWGAPEYLSEFAREIEYQRTPEKGFGGDVIDNSFVGVVLGGSEEVCKDEYLDRTLISSAATETAKQGWSSLQSKPRVLCASGASGTSLSPGGTADGQWGINKIMQKQDWQNAPLDDLVRSTDLHRAIKDVVLVSSSPKHHRDGTSVIMGGLMTLARTRYVEFPHAVEHSQHSSQDDAAAPPKLSAAVEKLDHLGFNCYWRGRRGPSSTAGLASFAPPDEVGEGLYRLSGCWQDFYDSQGGTVACVNRNLAPKMAERMEDVFWVMVGANRKGEGGAGGKGKKKKPRR